MSEVDVKSPDETQLWGAIAEVTEAMPMVIMRRIVDQVLLLVATADGAVVELVDGDVLTYVCAAGTLSEHVGIRLARAGSLSGLAVERAETLHCRDARTDDRVDRQACARVGTVSMVCVPLHRQGVPVGVLKVSAGRAHAFDGEDVAVLTKLADFIIGSISAASQIAKITHDLQTGLEAPGPCGEAGTQPGTDGPGAVSEFVANVLRPGIAAELAIRQQLEAIIAARDINILCQPIVDLDSGQLIAAEALARFPGPPDRPPDVWFGLAHQSGLGVPLQLLAVELAVGLLDELPAHVRLCINAGPDAILAAELPAILEQAGAERVVLELTEHLEIASYDQLRRALSELREHGTTLAVDDTGAGVASMAHIVKLAPDLIKLDRAFTTGIDIDPVRRSVAGAFVTLAGETGANIVAEGIETAAELDTVRQLGIQYGQGYFIARPAPVSSLVRTYTHVRTGNGRGQRNARKPFQTGPPNARQAPSCT